MNPRILKAINALAVSLTHDGTYSPKIERELKEFASAVIADTRTPEESFL